ncbi:MAG: hypothetical protein JOZ69_10290 [Myxococcales bacterium]|nr:hypothetical protein [Myxococcales bacterium]
MNLDTHVLCATYRLSSRRRTVTQSEIAKSARRRRGDVVGALGRLAAAGLVRVQPTGACQLTLPGLVIAVAVTRARHGRGGRHEALSRAA